VYNYSTYTDRVLTRSVHQVRVYAFNAPTTCLRVWCTYEALTNQGEAHQYIDYVVCFIQSTVTIIQKSIRYYTYFMPLDLTYLCY